MKIHRSHPIAFAVFLAAAAVVIGADTKPKSNAKAAAPAAPAKDAAAAGEVVATVNGEAIQSAELEAAFTRAVAGRGMPVDGIPADQKKEAMRNLLNDVINERLLNKACAAVKIESAAVDAEFEKILASQEAQRGRKQTVEEVKSELAQMGMTLEGLKTNIQQRMKQRLWVDEQIKGKSAESTDADAKDFYEKNPQHFDLPEQVRASHILFMLKADASPDVVTATMKKAEAAIGRTKKEDFAKLAGELSEEPGAKDRGGDLNFFPRQGAMVEEFAEAAFKLKKDEVSPEPLRTQFGYHIIKVTDRKAGGKQPFEEAKPQILSYLSREKKRIAIDEVVGGLRAKADVKINLPEPAAKTEAVTPPVGVPPKK